MRLIAASVGFFVAAVVYSVSGYAPVTTAQAEDGPGHSDSRLLDGQKIFRFDTFGDEQLWTEVLRMHEVVSTVPPATALAVGLKVDVDALPPSVVAALAGGQVDLNDPAVTSSITTTGSSG